MSTVPPFPASNAMARKELIREMQQACAPRQRALLSLLAICNKHDLDTSTILSSFANDLPRTPLESRRRTSRFFWSRVLDLAEFSENEPAIPQGLDAVPRLLPETVDLALRLHDHTGSLESIQEDWLERSPDYAFDSGIAQTFIGRMIPLFLKTMVIIVLATFVMVRVIPELRVMMEEFALGSPLLFDTTITIFDTLVRFWFVAVLVLLLAVPLFLPSIRNYARKWNPFLWRQSRVPTPVKSRLALAMFAAHQNRPSSGSWKKLGKLAKAVNASNKTVPFELESHLDRLAALRVITKRESRALKMADHDETEAWILRKTANIKDQRIERRGFWWTRAVVMMVNVGITVLVVLLALSTFSVLIQIISQLQ